MNGSSTLVKCNIDPYPMLPCVWSQTGVAPNGRLNALQPYMYTITHIDHISNGAHILVLV